MPKFSLRPLIAACAILVGLVSLLSLQTGSFTAADHLPRQLSDQEFWRIVSDFSEPGGYFRSDNFLSNESGYQSVIPKLKEIARPGGVYLGVGPEQNFTYIAALQPRMAFILDIRRQNMLEHLLYKALMEISADRADFLSRLFSRPRPAGLEVNASALALFRAFRAVAPSRSLFNGNLQQVFNLLVKNRAFKLSYEDEGSIQKVHHAFFEAGPNMRYVFLDAPSAGLGMPSYAELMTETDSLGRNWSFLATEEQFRVVQRLQRNNLIVPLVGDFGGDKAIRSVGRYLKEHNAIVSAFYVSNVEMYLFQQGDDWKRFYANLAMLPIDSARSTFIRYVLNTWTFSYTRRIFGSQNQTLLSPIRDVVKAFNAGAIEGYYDIIDMSK